MYNNAVHIIICFTHIETRKVFGNSSNLYKLKFTRVRVFLSYSLIHILYTIIYKQAATSIILFIILTYIKCS